MPDDSDETGLTDADRIRTARSLAESIMAVLGVSSEPKPEMVDRAPADEVAKVMPE